MSLDAVTLLNSIFMCAYVVWKDESASCVAVCELHAPCDKKLILICESVNKGSSKILHLCIIAGFETDLKLSA